MNRNPKIMLATLALNEMEWLPRLVNQHKNWPGLAGWAFIEAADLAYAQSSPDSVSSAGLSTDGTTDFLKKVSTKHELIHYKGLGIVGDGGPQGKCIARNAYLELADDIQPEWVIVLDADEFYSKKDQTRINTLLLRTARKGIRPIILRQRHIWRPPSIAEQEPLLLREVVGAYWDIPHCRIFPWYNKMRYLTDHNRPVLSSGRELPRIMRMDKRSGEQHPQCVHVGFASTPKSRIAKHGYYVTRGEGSGDGRQSYVDCRAAWETWVPGSKLPYGATVIKYKGPYPEELCERR